MSETQVTWVDGMQFIAESAGHSIVVDGGPGFGRDTGMPPMQLLLLGAAGCSAMDVVHILQKRMHRTVTGLRVAVEAEQSDEHPQVYTRVVFKYEVKGRGIKQRSVRRAIELSHEKFCAAAIMLGATAQIETEFEIHEEE